jgi:putative chitobiose transport system substrate-binding protein
MHGYKTTKRFGIFSLLGLLLSFVFALHGCVPQAITSNPQAKSPGQNQEVEFWTMQLQPQFTDYFNQLIADFEAKNPPIKIRWVDVPWSAMESKILTAVSAKTAPDVVNFNPDFASQLASRNAWLELDGKVPASVRATYLPNIWKASTLNGRSFGLPWYLATGITIYNTDLLQQAGIAQPPKTYEELAQVAKQVKEKTGKYAFFTTFVPEDSASVLESFVQMGVQLVDAQGKAAFNTLQGKAAFQYWVDLYKNGLLPKEVLTQGHQRAIELYQAGETAILDSGVQFLSAIAKNAPTIAKVSAIAPQIIGKTGQRNVAVMNLVIPRDTDQPDHALKFALFVTNPENQLSFAKAANVLPSTVKTLQDSYFKTVPSSATPQDKARIISASGLAQAQVLIPAMKNRNLLQKAIYENLQAAMLGEKSVDQAVADAASEWNQS